MLPLPAGVISRLPQPMGSDALDLCWAGKIARFPDLFQKGQPRGLKQKQRSVRDLVARRFSISFETARYGHDASYWGALVWIRPFCHINTKTNPSRDRAVNISKVLRNLNCYRLGWPGTEFAETHGRVPMNGAISSTI